MFDIWGLITQVPDPTAVAPTGGASGFNWADYGPLGVMAFGLLSAVVVLWRKNERLEAESKVQAEKVFAVLFEVSRILPDVLESIKETRRGSADVTPALASVAEKMERLEKAVKTLAKVPAASKRKKQP